MVIEKDTLSRLHNVMLELLNKFVQICEENNLTYFLDGGTLLGAVRHKGFIPWDDDIDIAMPRNDYEKFLNISENINLTDCYVLSQRCPVNTLYHYKGYAKFCKKNTVFAEDYMDIKDNSGVFIDIWPFDNCFLFSLPIQAKLASFTVRLYRLITHYDIPSVKSKRLFIKLICCFVPMKFCASLLKYTYSIFSKFKTKYMCCFMGNHGYKKEFYRYDTIFPLTKLIFEGNYYCVPGQYDVFLKNLYGDYMELPPLEQQKGHSVKYILFGDDSAKISND